MNTDTLTSSFIPDQPETNRFGRGAARQRDRSFSAEPRAISLGRESPDVDELTYVVLQDSCLLIDHLSGRNDHSIATLELDCIETDEKGESHPKKVNLIDEVCSIRASIGGRAEFSKHAATLFKARDKLSVLAAPATCLTIAYTLLVAPGGNGRADFARKAYPNLITHAKGFRTW